MKHFLKTLGLPETATWEEIKEGYRDQMRVWHPDRFTGNERLHAKAEETTKEIGYAIRRLKELRADIEALGYKVDDNYNFLEQYYVKTRGGLGAHGSATIEDRRRGYVQGSFARWDAIAGSVIDSVRKRTEAVSPKSRSRRQRQPTMPLKRRKSQEVPSFLVVSGVLVLVTSIGALNIPRFMNHNSAGAAVQVQPANPEADRKLLKELLEEPAPKYERNMDLTSKLNLIEKRKNESRPELVTAAMNCDGKEVARLLDQHRAAINEADSSGQTPLIWAAKRNCAAVARLLIKRGADKNARSSNGFSAYRWAQWYRNYDTIQTFEALSVRQ